MFIAKSRSSGKNTAHTQGSYMAEDALREEQAFKHSHTKKHGSNRKLWIIKGLKCECTTYTQSSHGHMATCAEIVMLLC